MVLDSRVKVYLLIFIMSCFWGGDGGIYGFFFRLRGSYSRETRF